MLPGLAAYEVIRLEITVPSLMANGENVAETVIQITKERRPINH